MHVYYYPIHRVTSRIVSASNAEDLEPPPDSRGNWRIPTNDLVKRELAMIDMVIMIMNARRNNWAKQQRPYTSDPKHRDDLNLPKSYRPRSAYSTRGPVLQKPDNTTSLLYDEGGNPKNRPCWSKECRI